MGPKSHDDSVLCTQGVMQCMFLLLAFDVYHVHINHVSLAAVQGNWLQIANRSRDAWIKLDKHCNRHHLLVPIELFVYWLC